jgi:lysophospholipase L1-like esterase
MAGLRPAGRLRRGAAYVLVLLVAPGLALLLAELWAAGRVELPGSYYLRHARLNHAHVPNADVYRREIAGLDPEFPDPPLHHYNAQGWVEERDVAVERAPGVTRIFYVGDSFVMGYVPTRQAMPKLVEAELNRGLPSPRYEVINTGTPSYSPTIEYVLIRYYLAPYRPDVIVLCVDMTDDYDDWVYRHGLVVDADGNPYAVPTPNAELRPFVNAPVGAVRPNWMLRLSLLLYERSHLYNLLLQRAQARPGFLEAARRDAERFERETDSEVTFYRRAQWCRHEWDEATEAAARHTLDLLGRIADFCRAQGIRLLVTGVPHSRQFVRPPDTTPEWSLRPHRELERVAREKGVAYFDGVAALAPAVDGTPHERYYLSRDMHFNPRGNALWAEAHVRALRDPALGLLAEP